METKPLTVHVPALLLYEAGNILLLKTDLDPDGLEKAVENLETLPFVVAPPATPLLRRAAQLGKEFTLTFYDASFLALAVELDCPLVTADGRFFDRTKSLSRVRHLSKIGALKRSKTASRSNNSILRAGCFPNYAGEWRSWIDCTYHTLVLDSQMINQTY